MGRPKTIPRPDKKKKQPKPFWRKYVAPATYSKEYLENLRRLSKYASVESEESESSSQQSEPESELKESNWLIIIYLNPEKNSPFQDYHILQVWTSFIQLYAKVICSK